MVVEDDETSKDKKIDKLMALISLSFKKIYKPTNNNLRTSSNTSRVNQDNSPRINRNAGYENQRIGNVAGDRETVARECQKPKRAKDVAYHREKMLLCKQEEAGTQLNEEQADWRDDTDDDELEDQELEAHYMYMSKLQEVSPDAADSGPIFDDEPLQKVSNDDHYNVFAMESVHPEQSESVHDTYPIEQNEQNVIIDSLDMSNDREEIDQNDDNDFAKEREIEDFKNKNKSLESSNNFFKEANNRLSETNNLLYADYKKSEAELARRNSTEYASQMELECAKKEAQIKLYKTQEDKELDKVIELENKVKVLDNIVYKTGQSVQTMNMLNNKCRTSFAKPEFLKKAQRANPRMYDIGFYNDNLALMLTPDSDEVIRLEKERRSKLSDLIRPFDYDKLNNLCLNEEMVADLRYFNSLESEVDSLRSQLETHKTQSLNKIDRLSREYYYADHMNAILGVYTELDEDLKAQLQDKGIVISELKKLIEKIKGKFVDTKFEKSSVIRQSNAFKSQRPSVLGKPTTFSNSFIRKDFSKSTSVTQTHVSNNFSKPVTAQTLPPNKKSILKNTNMLAPGMYKLHTKPNQTRTSQLPPDSRKTNKRVSFSTGVIPTTSVSRPPLKSNPRGDRVMHNNSRGKK
nr:hypothetical protein [Tanacetum cinerariifolium]